MSEAKTPECLNLTWTQLAYRGPSLIEFRFRASPDPKGQSGVREYLAILTPEQADELGREMMAAAQQTGYVASTYRPGSA